MVPLVPAAGVQLPVLARDRGGAILSFSDLFQPLPEGRAKPSKPVRTAVSAFRRKMRAATVVIDKRGAACYR